jgi:hypothetical protein
LRFPLTNTVGAPQTIDFPAIADQDAGAGAIKLAARSSAGVPVSYYVREGPAQVDRHGVLTFTEVPPRSRYPLKVTVVAWQWGRSIDPQLQTAAPVERTFSLAGPPLTQ